MNEEQKKRIEKFFSPEGAKHPSDLRPTSGFVEVGNHPIDRLRRGLRSVFPGMPDVVLSKDEEKDERFVE